VLGQLLVPGQLCRTALREALLFWGAALGQDQVDGASYDQLKVRAGEGGAGGAAVPGSGRGSAE
jgi:hypothetical protein